MVRLNFILIVIFLLLVGCATTDQDWKKAKDLNTVEAYEMFLRENPNSKYTIKAQWNQFKILDTTIGYEWFLKTYPKSEYSKEAKRLYDFNVLRDWEDTKSEGTLFAYKAFINRNPKSEFTSEANNIVAKEEFSEAKKKNTKKAYKFFLLLNPDSKYSDEARRFVALKDWEEVKSKDTKLTYMDFLFRNPDSKFSREAQHQIALKSNEKNIFIWKTTNFSDDPFRIVSMTPSFYPGWNNHHDKLVVIFKSQTEDKLKKKSISLSTDADINSHLFLTDAQSIKDKGFDAYIHITLEDHNGGVQIKSMHGRKVLKEENRIVSTISIAAVMIRTRDNEKIWSDNFTYTCNIGFDRFGEMGARKDTKKLKHYESIRQECGEKAGELLSERFLLFSVSNSTL